MSRLFNGAKIFKFATIFFAAFLLAACAATDTTSGSSTTTTDASRDDPTPGSARHFLQEARDRVYFAFDRYDLSEDAQADLRLQAAWLDQYPGTTVVIEGHADERGTREYNLALGQRRAESARAYLVSLGVDPARIRTISYGKERPVAPEHNERAWRLNRRAVTVVTSPYGS